MAFIGPRNDNFDLVDNLKDVVGDVLGIRDTIGGKRANVYWLTKEQGKDDVWEQVLPTPDVQFFNLQQSLDTGGIISEGEVTLKDIPISVYSESDLETASRTEGKRKFWILAGPGLETKAYTTKSINKKDLFKFDVYIQRFKSLNPEDLIIPEEVDMALTQQQVDDRIRALATQTNHLFEAEMSLPATQIDEGTEQKISITARHGVAEQGITLADNQMTFVNEGLYNIHGSLLMRQKPNGVVDQNSRCIMKALAKHIRGVAVNTIPESQVTSYIRAYDGATTAGTTHEDWGYVIIHLSFSYIMQAGDKMEVYVQPIVKQQNLCTYQLEANSLIEATWNTLD